MCLSETCFEMHQSRNQKCNVHKASFLSIPVALSFLPHFHHHSYDDLWIRLIFLLSVIWASVRFLKSGPSDQKVTEDAIPLHDFSSSKGVSRVVCVIISLTCQKLLPVQQYMFNYLSDIELIVAVIHACCTSILETRGKDAKDYFSAEVTCACTQYYLIYIQYSRPAVFVEL